MPKSLIALLVWPIALAAIPAKNILFDGQIYVWPFLLASCAVAATQNWRAAAALAVGVAGAQLIEQFVNDPVFYQFAFYATLGFVALLFVDTVAALTAAIVSFIYFGVTFNLEWRASMIGTEIVIVAGLHCGMLNGPSGGILRPVEGRTLARRVVAYSAVRFRQFVGDRAIR